MLDCPAMFGNVCLSMGDEFADGTNFSCTNFSTALWKSYLLFNTDLGLRIEFDVALAIFCNVGVMGAMETFLDPGNKHNVEMAS